MIKKVFGGDKVASITDIKVKILELAPAPFQEFCDTLLSKMGYGAIHGLGMKAGTGNTTIGNPDTYFRKENGRYVFVAYTIQQTCIFSKLKEDIEKCLDTSKTGLDVSQIEEIVCGIYISRGSEQRNVNKYFNEYLDPEYRFNLSVNVLLSCEGISLWQKILDCLRASILCVSYISYLYFTEQKRTV